MIRESWRPQAHITPSKFIAMFESLYLLCYLRGPAGIIVALAEQIG